MRSRPATDHAAWVRAAAAAACAGLVAAFTIPSASGYAFLNSRWPGGTILMHLQLGTSGPLSDGSEGWGQSAETALAAWNQTMNKVQFHVVRESSAARGDGNHVNNVFFGTDIYGMAFDTSVVAVTTSWSRRSSRTEADVIFNARKIWDAYRGPLKPGAMEFHRVALHEFGHVLGLDHPDEHGQALAAVMNSRIGSVDRLSNDDIAGARALYGTTESVGAGVAFPPRNESLDFRLQLETKYRDGLRRGTTATTVDNEGDVVWTQEYLRYRVNACSHEQALERVTPQIAGGPVPPACGPAKEGPVLFPPRSDALRFRIVLEGIYRDTLGRAPIATYVDQEGDIVWLQEYLRYRVNGCGHGVAVQSVFLQIDGAPPPALCR